MRRSVMMSAAAAMLVATAPAAAQSSPRGAEGQCRDRVQGQYGASTRGVTSSDRGGGRYQVTGNSDRNGETAWFTCRVQNGYVNNLDMGDWSKRSGGGDGGAIAAVGAAVLLGAIIAAASSKKKSHEYDNSDNRPPPSGDNRYSPAYGVNCYRDQRACFDDRQNYLASWTSREFNY